ncbi:MAG: type II toxin-antitoxin system VapC family toxin [Chloroflexi bacterium]|nr:type II toxin-antitoxin system VapC family toxin [Chloroflexota bacterium]MYE40625.1 type II toxin-antitoxin system VapC family toxin [Chloroflexota bacterium]
MLLLDANIAMYAEGREHRYQQPCKRVMELAKANSSDYCVDTEILQEILYVYYSRGETDRGIGVAQDILGMFPTIIPITTAEITIAMRLMSETRRLSARDAIHAAVVINHNLEGIVSADQDFVRIPGLRRFDPIEVAAG